MKVLNVLTTATPRHDIHKGGLFKAIAAIPKDVGVKWFVNLDHPSMISEEERAESYRGFIEFAEQHSNVKLYIHNSNIGNFDRAAEYLFFACRDRIRNNLSNRFLWLEDDWILNDEQAFVQSIEEAFRNKASFFHFAQTPYLSGNPHIFTKKHFWEVIRYYKENDLIDPELTFMAVKKVMYKDDDLRIPAPDSIHRQRTFFDLGRKWRDRRGIEKADKFAKNKSTWT